MKNIWLILALIFTLPPAFAQEAAKTINMETSIKDDKGVPVKDLAFVTKDDPSCAHCPVLTVGTVISRALNAVFADEPNLPGDQKWARSLLAQRLKDDKVAKLTAKEAELIERLVGKGYSGDVIRQIMPLIDPNKKPPDLQ
jgi:hypothetical protein